MDSSKAGTTELTLDNLIDNNKPVYVINNSNPRGVIVISIVHPATGNVTPITIPVTWIPICVTDIVPRKHLRDSLDFRGALRKNMLRLVDPDRARKVLATQEAKEEQKRLNESDYAATEGLNPKPVTAEGETEAINPRVMDIVIRLTSKDIGVSEALNRLKSLFTTLTKQDLSYILTNAPQKQIKAWAEKAITSKE